MNTDPSTWRLCWYVSVTQILYCDQVRLRPRCVKTTAKEFLTEHGVTRPMISHVGQAGRHPTAISHKHSTLTVFDGRASVPAYSSVLLHYFCVDFKKPTDPKGKDKKAKHFFWSTYTYGMVVIILKPKSVNTVYKVREQQLLLITMLHRK